MFGIIYFIFGFVSGICFAQDYDLPKMKPFIRALLLHFKSKIDNYSLNVHKNQQINPSTLISEKELNEVFSKSEKKRET